MLSITTGRPDGLATCLASASTTRLFRRMNMVCGCHGTFTVRRLRLGIARDPKNYEWTSYPAYLGQIPKGFLKPGVILDQFGRGQAARYRYEEFVMNEEEGPIDWNASYVSVVGDDEFVDHIEKSKLGISEERMNDKDLIEAVSRRLRVGAGLLLHPHGRTERRLRHEAFVILVNSYGLCASEVARLFGVCTKTVTKILWK